MKQIRLWKLGNLDKRIFPALSENYINYIVCGKLEPTVRTKTNE